MRFEPSWLRHELSVLCNPVKRVSPETFRQREIVEQVLAGSRMLARRGFRGPGRISNVVLMGMGEPLANYNRVVKALRLLTAEALKGWGCLRGALRFRPFGLVPRIRQPAGEGLPSLRSFRCTRRMTNFGTNLCRSTIGGPWLRY